MFKRFTSTLLILSFIICAIPFSASAAVNALYVSPSGNDSYSGSIDAPLASMDGARKKIQELKASGTYINEVIFRGGDYRITSTVRFTAEDSGTEDNPIVYRAYEGETPRFKGSVLIDNTKVKSIATTDSAYNRVHEDAKGKVFYFDLTEHGLTREDICDTSYGKVCFDSRLTDYGGYNTLFIDEAEIDISTWPNGNKYTAWDVIPSNVSSDEKGRIFHYTDSNPENWLDAPEGWWIAASPQYDFQYLTVSVEKIDTQADTITVSPNGVGMKFVRDTNSPKSQKWKAYNLLEEIDVPGEFAIDRENMRLYLYPPYDISDSKLELSVIGKNPVSAKSNPTLISVKRASNITFEGLEFSQSRQNGVGLYEINNIDFIDCTFKNIAATALSNGNVYSYYQTDPETGKTGNVKTGFDPFHDHYIAWNITPNQAKLIYNDSSYNMDIKGCVFSSIGVNAMSVNGGNIDSLTKSGNIIENNYITDVNKRYAHNSAIYLSGCGNTFRNNVITHSRQNAIFVNGSLHTIEKNELYDVMRDTGDFGAIYQGGSILYRGTEIKENYIHDIFPANPLVVSGAVGIYMDEGQQGNNIHNNIIVNAEIGYNSNWAEANKFTDNIIVDCNTPWAFHNRDVCTREPQHNYPMELINGGYLKNSTTYTPGYRYNAERNEAFIKKYKETYGEDAVLSLPPLTMEEYIGTIPDEYEAKYRETFPELFAWAEAEVPFSAKTQSVYSGNLIVRSGKSTTNTMDNEKASWSRTEGKYADNVRVSATTEFMNAKNHDYRLKDGHYHAEKLPGLLNNSNFEMTSIGLTDKQKTFNAQTSPYRLLYPANGTAVSKKGLMLMWQEAFGANEYLVEIATDEEFTDIIFSQTARYNHIDAESAILYSGNTYYWRVIAVNTSKDMSGMWITQEAVSNFRMN